MGQVHGEGGARTEARPRRRPCPRGWPRWRSRWTDRGRLRRGPATAGIGPVEAFEDVLRLLGLHPGPLSATVITAPSPSGSTATRAAVPGGVWARTLPSRLSTTWRRLVASPITSIGAGGLEGHRPFGSDRRTRCGPPRRTGPRGRPTAAPWAGPRPGGPAAAGRPPDAPSGRLGADPAHQPLEIGLLLGGAPTEQLGVGGDGGDRGAQLVGGVGHEPAEPGSEARSRRSEASRAPKADSILASMTLRVRASRPTSVVSFSPGTRSVRLPAAMDSAVVSMSRRGRSPRRTNQKPPSRATHDGGAGDGQLDQEQMVSVSTSPSGWATIRTSPSSGWRPVPGTTVRWPGWPAR